jgi:hypothetical protein
VRGVGGGEGDGWGGGVLCRGRACIHNNSYIYKTSGALLLAEKPGSFVCWRLDGQLLHISCFTCKQTDDQLQGIAFSHKFTKAKMKNRSSKEIM